MDGANEWQLFWYVLFPMLRPVLVVVALTLTINALKVFDLVYVMTFGNHETDVIANRMYSQMYVSFNAGRGTAVAVVLVLVIIPFIYMNIKRFIAQEEMR